MKVGLTKANFLEEKNMKHLLTTCRLLSVTGLFIAAVGCGSIDESILKGDPSTNDLDKKSELYESSLPSSSATDHDRGHQNNEYKNCNYDKNQNQDDYRYDCDSDRDNDDHDRYDCDKDRDSDDDQHDGGNEQDDRDKNNVRNDKLDSKNECRYDDDHDSGEEKDEDDDHNDQHHDDN